MKILHIHQDYPDGRPYPYTKAVSNLIDGCKVQDSNLEHLVVSINRTSNPLKVSTQVFDQGVSIVYWAIPLPYIYYWSMKLSSLYIHNKIKKFKIDMIHAHKLTCEGVLAYFLAKKMHVPYSLSIRGGSDMHNTKRLSAHNPFFSKIFNKAKHIFWVSLWAKDYLQDTLNLNQEKVLTSVVLPNICNINLSYPHKDFSERKGYITAVSFHQYKRKGISELIESIAILNKNDPSIELYIYGSGDDIYKNEIEKLIVSFAAQSCVFLKGQVHQQELLTAMSYCKGFLLPAVNETFGMAYIEALSVGCPILYVENTGVDGYFDDIRVGEKITKLCTHEIAKSIKIIEDNNEELCKQIKSLQNTNFLSMYTYENVVFNYLTQIKNV